jgi:hypothetical protein
MNGANYNVPLARAVRGPLLMIAAGSLFALDHFGSYSFSTTWPVLLILIGLLKLLERVTPPTSSTPAQPLS